jgi:hypothetical protein
MSDSKKPDLAALEAAKAVMKRMLATPPTPHEAMVGDKRKRGKTRGKAKR